jgi:hypothetical protein
MSKCPMRGHFQYVRFKTFPMTPRTPQCEVFCVLLSSYEHLGVPEDSKSPTFPGVGLHPPLGQVRVATNYVFGALVDASSRAELYGTTDRSIDPDRLVCRSRISILEVSTPNLSIVQDPFVSLLRTPLPCLEHWWMPPARLTFMALQTDRSIPIDWSVRAGSAFSRRPPPIC